MSRTGIDTNILLRSVVGDDEVQTPLARKFLLGQRDAGGVVYLSSIVLVEVLWALRQSYKFSKKDLVGLIQSFLTSQGMEVEEAVATWEALHLYENSSADFADCLILVRNQKIGVSETMTFDKKAAKVDGFTLLA